MSENMKTIVDEYWSDWTRRKNMTEEQLTILAIKGAISELPPHQEEACNDLAEHMRRMIKEAGSPVGELAVALVGAEMQAAIDE